MIWEFKDDSYIMQQLSSLAPKMIRKISCGIFNNIQSCSDNSPYFAVHCFSIIDRLVNIRRDVSDPDSPGPCERDTCVTRWHETPPASALGVRTQAGAGDSFPVIVFVIFGRRATVKTHNLDKKQILGLSRRPCDIIVDRSRIISAEFIFALCCKVIYFIFTWWLRKYLSCWDWAKRRRRTVYAQTIFHQTKVTMKWP